MTRTTSANFRSAAFAQDTDEVVVCLLTITHESMAEPIRLCNDPAERLSTEPLTYGTTSRGETFLFLPFAFTLPTDRDDTPPRVAITLDNVERGIIGLLRSIATPLEVTVEIVLAASPDVVEVQLPAMQMSDITYNVENITANLVVDGLQTEPFPSGQFDRGRFPGLF